MITELGLLEGINIFTEALFALKTFLILSLKLKRTVLVPVLGFSLNNIAILVRAIFQTREFEERFLKIGIPYRILGGTKFYERAEIKDCVAYLRLVSQEKDDLAFERIVNNPKRSIGETTLKDIHTFSKKNSLCLEISAKRMIDQNLIKPKAKVGLNIFLDLILW